MEKNSWKYVIKDMKKRNKAGMKEYGVPLTTETKKDFLQETYEELLDAVVYLRTELQLRRQNKLTEDLNCPEYGGNADNGFDRCIPPSPYYCTKCSTPSVDPIIDEHSIFHPYPFKENN